MINKERSDITKHYEDQYTLSSKTRKPEAIIDMANKTDSKVEISKSENKILNIPPTEPLILSNAMDNEDHNNVQVINDKLGKENVDEINENNENLTYIIRIYETYYEKEQSQDQHHQREPFQRQSLHQQYPNQWGGGGNYGEPLVYDPETRNYFVKLVFSILLTMLVVTSLFIALVLATDAIKDVFRAHGLLFYIVGAVLLLICHYAMFLSPCARVPPCNIVMLILAVVAFCIIGGNVSARYRTEIVLYAAMATTAVVFICLMLACTKFDFTSWLLYVVVIAAVFGVISMIIFVSALITRHYPKPLHIAVLVIGTLIQVVMLIIELQMVLGGKNVELNEDDYAIGAFMLYTSIMSLFINLLQLIGYAN